MCSSPPCCQQLGCYSCRGVNTAMLMLLLPELSFLSISSLLLLDSSPLVAAADAAARRRRQMNTPPTAAPMPATAATATTAHTQAGVPPLLPSLPLLALGAGAVLGLLAGEPLQLKLRPSASTSTSPTAGRQGIAGKLQIALHGIATRVSSRTVQRSCWTEAAPLETRHAAGTPHPPLQRQPHPPAAPSAASTTGAAPSGWPAAWALHRSLAGSARRRLCSLTCALVRCS